jgi:hypothetical protein
MRRIAVALRIERAKIPILLLPYRSLTSRDGMTAMLAPIIAILPIAIVVIDDLLHRTLPLSEPSKTLTIPRGMPKSVHQ